MSLHVRPVLTALHHFELGTQAIDEIVNRLAVTLWRLNRCAGIDPLFGPVTHGVQRHDGSTCRTKAPIKEKQAPPRGEGLVCVFLEGGAEALFVFNVSQIGTGHSSVHENPDEPNIVSLVAEETSALLNRIRRPRASTTRHIGHGQPFNSEAPIEPGPAHENEPVTI